MKGNCIKLSDFARDCGVTDRAVQKHLKKLETELEGHFERRGPQGGTWLDEFAQEKIRARMITPAPPVVADNRLMEENAELRRSVMAMQQKYIELQERMMEQTALIATAEANKRLLDAATEREGELRQAAQESREKAVEAEKRAESAAAEAAAARAAAAEAQAALDAERSRKLSIKERLFGQKSAQ